MPNKLVDMHTHALGKKGFDYDQVHDDVFIGTNMCCQFGFDRELLAKGVRADISLEKDRIDAPAGVDYFLWLPTEDRRSPAQNQLMLGAQTIDFFVRQHVKVYIHCKKGHGRAPTLFIAYLICTGRSFDDALRELRSKRPSVHLTDAQVSGLRSFASPLAHVGKAMREKRLE